MTLDQNELHQILSSAKKASKLGREVLMDYYGRLSRVKEKELAGLVTEADLESEKAITEYLLKEYPTFEILGEEGFSLENRGLVKRPQSLPQSPCWVIDPLDGTTNYVHSFPVFCISIGLVVDEQVVLGVVEAPVLNQVFTAIRGEGAFLNDLPIKVSSRNELKDSLLATGFFAQNKTLLEEQITLFKKVIDTTRGVRRAGAAAYDLCMVASGVFEGFWEKNLMPWDTAAGSLLVHEAGGRVSDFDGVPYHPLQSSILAANPRIHEKIVGLTKSIHQP
jgi:myo-inositol-1(or 4)-monophosphatase